MEILFLIWNFLVFFLYGIDKLFAKTGARRVRETTLILPALLLGGVGAMFGMVVFNHKTSKTKFRFWVPLAVVVNAVLIWVYYNIEL